MRTLAFLFLAVFALPSMAANGGAWAITMDTNYILLATAVIQVVIILSLAGILRTLGGAGKAWMQRLGKGGPAALIAFALLQGSDAQAATTEGPAAWTATELFWWLLTVNLFLFLLILVQLVLVRSLTRAWIGESASGQGARATGEPSFADKVLKSLTRQVDMEHEKDLLMHHEYDGIRELDNVLPPWWLWLFYGTIIWSVVYLFNMHVSHTWKDQTTEYEMEMAQAKADVDAYLAKFAALVDENSVTALTDASALKAGEVVFKENCIACHGQLGEGKEGLGPNLTDAYWLHGGNVKDVFKTVKYGVQAKGMASWKDMLKPLDIQNVASYILSLQGSNPPNAIAPQGTLMAPEDAGTASADTARVAALEQP